MKNQRKTRRRRNHKSKKTWSKKGKAKYYLRWRPSKLPNNFISSAQVSFIFAWFIDWAMTDALLKSSIPMSELTSQGSWSDWSCEDQSRSLEEINKQTYLTKGGTPRKRKVRYCGRISYRFWRSLTSFLSRRTVRACIDLSRAFFNSTGLSSLEDATNLARSFWILAGFTLIIT